MTEPARAAFLLIDMQNGFIIERLGKFNRTVGAGLNIKIPFFETIAAKVDMRTRQEQFGIDAKTRDNVTVTMAIAAQPLDNVDVLLRNDEQRLGQKQHQKNDDDSKSDHGIPFVEGARRWIGNASPDSPPIVLQWSEPTAKFKELP